MKFDAKAHRKITSVADVARLFGLRASAAPEQIARQFGRLVNFEADLEIEVAECTMSVDEVWQVKIERTLPRPRISLRPSGRGSWTTRFDDIPRDVRDHFRVVATRDGGMETTRSWKAWERTNWAKGAGKRLKARNGEIQALVEISGVRRETGERETYVRIEPVVDPDMTAPDPVRLALPCTAGMLAAAVAAMRTMPAAA